MPGIHTIHRHRFIQSKLFTVPTSLFWELRLGVHTRGRLGYMPGPDSIWYQTMSYAEIFTVLRELHLGPSDTFVDLGCGKGRVVFSAAQFHIREAIGVELDKSLCTIAESNSHHVRNKKCSIRIVNTPAEDYDYRDGNVYYMYHPFGAVTLTKVLGLIKQSLKPRPRPIKIAYVHPVHEDVLYHTDWLVNYDVWEQQSVIFHKVSFWKTKIYW